MEVEGELDMVSIPMVGKVEAMGEREKEAAEEKEGTETPVVGKEETEKVPWGRDTEGPEEALRKLDTVPVKVSKGDSLGVDNSLVGEGVLHPVPVADTVESLCEARGEAV